MLGDTPLDVLVVGADAWVELSIHLGCPTRCECPACNCSDFEVQGEL